MSAKGQRLLCTAGAAVSVGAVGFALFTQFRLGLEPCAWCVLQRLIYLCIAAAAIPGMLTGTRLASWFSGLMMTLLALSGVAAAGWHFLVASKSESCAFTLADRIVRGRALDELLPDVFSATAPCSQKATLLGVPYELLSLAMFALLAAYSFWVMRRQR